MEKEYKNIEELIKENLSVVGCERIFFDRVI